MTKEKLKEFENLTDEELISLYRNGEEEVMDYLCGKYKYLVKFAANSLYLEGAEKDDLIQEGMIGLFKAIGAFDVERGASFKSFAALCIKRGMYNAIEASGRLKNEPLNSYVSLSDEETDDAKTPVDFSSNPELMVISDERRKELLDSVLRSLSPLESKAFLLYLEGFDYEAIAKTLGKSKKTVDNAISRSKKKLNTP